MRLECTNRDCKTGVLLHEGDDHHALTNPLHLHRLLLALVTADWLCALVGLQAWQDLPSGTSPAPFGSAVSGASPAAAPAPAATRPPALDTVPPLTPPTPALLDQGPRLPPPVLPHRGPTPPPPPWMRRFATRGWLSYIRLGLEILRAPDLRWLVRRAVRWLALYLWSTSPLWRPRQDRYRRLHWWPDAA
jgi:hypothetical protein